jgi:hypothetical protein
MMLEMYKVAQRQCIIRQQAQVLCNQVLCDVWPHQTFILLLDSRGQLVEKVILCGNHSSGDLTLLPEDVAVTQQLVAAGQHLDIELVDHLVIGNQRFVSLKERLRW